MRSLLLLVQLLLVFCGPLWAFIVGGCIGPKTAFERYLTATDKKELKRIVHENFDGQNQAEVLSEVYHFVHGHVTESQWEEIYPEIEKYRQQHHECSVYAQLLPSHLYKQLLTSVYKASETGADKHEVKRLVEEYIERLLVEGALDRLTTLAPQMKPAISVSSGIMRRVALTNKPAPSAIPFESTTTGTTSQATTVPNVPVRAANYLVMAPLPPVRITLRPPLSINLLLSSTEPTTSKAPALQPTPFAGLSKTLEEKRRFDSLARQFLRERQRVVQESAVTPETIVYNKLTLPPAPPSTPNLYTLFPRALPIVSDPYGRNHETLGHGGPPAFPLVELNPYYYCPATQPNCCHYCARHAPQNGHQWPGRHRRPQLLVERWDDRRYGFGRMMDAQKSVTTVVPTTVIPTTVTTTTVPPTTALSTEAAWSSGPITPPASDGLEAADPDDGWDVVSRESKERLA